MKTSQSIYLDHSASTPMDERVVETMMPYLSGLYGNSSSSHRFGRDAEKSIEDARETIANIFNCKPSEIVFTSGGSESDNLAIRGAGWGRRYRNDGNHLITTPVEHSAVGRTVAQMATMMGFDATYLQVDPNGMIDVETLASAFKDETTFASVIYANNEVGSINPIPQLAEIARQHNVLFHTDAVQAAGQLTLDVEVLGIDLMSISGHKFYGPKGVGALYIREGTPVVPSQTGGSHEYSLRAGTHNTPFIVGMAKALELAYTEKEAHLSHYRTLRDKLINGILSGVESAVLTGHPEQRTPSHASFIFEGIDSSTLLMHLDMKGIAASGGSACKTGNPEPSGVLLAMGLTEAEAIGSLRLSVGRQTTESEIDYAIETVTETVNKLYKLKENM